MGKASPQTVVLDAGALLALERGDARMRAVLREALRVGARVVIPAAVLAQVFRDGARQVALRALIKAPNTAVVAFGQILADAVGTLCGRKSPSDVVDASVVLVARRERAVVVTSDESDLRRLDPLARLMRI